MGDQPIRPRLEDFLDGWKAIAEHLGRTERTVQRWEKSKGLPVRRLQSDSAEEQPRVFAYKTEVDAWWKEHQTKLVTDDEPVTAPAPTASAQAAPASSQTAPVSAQIAPAPTQSAPSPAHGTTDSRPRTFRWPGWTILGVVAVILAIVAPRWIGGRSWPWTKKDVKVLGVVPVKNLSGAGDPDPQQLAEALTEEMVTGLSRLQPKRFVVIQLPPDSGGQQLDQVAKAHRLDYLLKGSVQRAGSKVAITAQLMLAKDQSLTWANSYERDLRNSQDIIPIELEITDAIISEVRPLLPHDQNPPQQVNREAYEAYLWGRLLWNKRTSESLFQAISYFERAINSDPKYAPAYAGVADCYFLLGSVPYTALPPSDAFPKAEAAARKALELDNSLAEAHISLGYSALVYRRDFAEAERQFQIALNLRPDYAPAHQFYGYYFTAMGRLDEAIRERRAARDLEPLNPVLHASLGEAYYQARQYNLVVEENQKSLVSDPGYPVSLMNIAGSYEQQGVYSKADAILEQILAAAPNEPAVLGMAGHEFAVSGRASQARAMLARLQHLKTQRYVSPLYFALVYIGLGDKNQAFAALDQAYAENSEYLVYLRTEPWADPLRQDPRFLSLLKKLGFPADQVASGVRAQ